MNRSLFKIKHPLEEHSYIQCSHYSNMSIANSARLTFPVRLHGLLTQATRLGLDNIISWHSSGKKFIIYNQKAFVERILPNIFKQSKFASFRRQMNAYGFERELNPDKTDDALVSFLVYSHKHFRRDDPCACSQISRISQRRHSPQHESTSAPLEAKKDSPGSSQSSSPKLEVKSDWNMKSFLSSPSTFAKFAWKHQPVKPIDSDSQDSDEEILKGAQFMSFDNAEETESKPLSEVCRPKVQAPTPLIDDFSDEELSVLRSDGTIDDAIISIYKGPTSNVSKVPASMSDTILDELADTIFDSGISRDCMSSWDPQEESLGNHSPIISTF